MPKKLLLGEDGQDDVGFRINENFAKKYQEKKKKEELSNLEEKYREKLAQKGANFKKGTFDSETEEDELSETDSETEVTEDEDGELVTPAIEAQILKTIAEIRARDEKIYDTSVNFFSPEELKKKEVEWNSIKVTQKATKSAKPIIKLKDYHRERLLLGQDLQEENASEEEQQPKIKTHEQEQAELLNQFKLAASQTINNNEDDDDLLKVRVKNDEEIAREEAEYRKFLLESLSTNTNARQSMGEWLEGKSSKDLNDQDQFLVEYILNRGWVEKDRKALPTYDEIVADEDEEDAEAVEKAEEYEEKYNFRFEQPGGDQIITYSRNIEGSLRRKDSKRKEQRMARKERKIKEKEQQREELKRLKNLKRQEIQEKLQRIERITGLQGVKDLDLEDEFDPIEHDRKMQALFDEDYYYNNDNEDKSKPVFSDGSDVEPEDSQLQTKIIQKATKTLTKAAKKAAKREADGKEAILKDRLGKYLDEYYQLDYEDMIDGKLPCRFKYQNVKPTTFGLKISDIIMADDSDLNAHASLKKLAPYRPQEVLESDEAKYGNKRRVYKFYDLLRRKRDQEGGKVDPKPFDQVTIGKQAKRSKH